MILTLLEIGIVVAMAFYLQQSAAGVRRRQEQAWDRLVAQLKPDCITPGWSYQSLLNDDQDATPEEKWRSIQSANGLWAMYENARVMLDMADYAELNGDAVDPELLEALRIDAMQIRVCALAALTKYACSQANECTAANAARAAEKYADMVARMAELMRLNSGVLVPSVVGTM